MCVGWSNGGRRLESDRKEVMGRQGGGQERGRGVGRMEREKHLPVLLTWRWCLGSSENRGWGFLGFSKWSFDCI